MFLIGATGPAGSGKDTVADYLVLHHGFQRMAFAAGLKEMLASVGMPEPADRALKEERIPGFDFSWRQAAQALGTEWGRALDPNIWVKITRAKIERARDIRAPGACRIILTDCRFENEAVMIRELGGEIWHLHGRRAELGAAAAHSSESGVQFCDCDRNIPNNNSVEALHRLIDTILGYQK